MAKDRYPRSRNSRVHYTVRWSRMFVLLLIVAVVVIAAILLLRPKSGSPGKTPDPTKTTLPDGTVVDIIPETPTPTPSPTPAPPTPVDATKPDAFGLRTDLNVDGDNVSSYTRKDPVYFDEGEEYAAIEGIIAFRGNNYRAATSFGTPNVKNAKMEVMWNVVTASVPKGTGSGKWTGVGWTGQPLIVRWPAKTRAIMNINETKKAKDGLVEVIYAAEDGLVYFIDLEDGLLTRKTINVGNPFKGSGCLDPRGYPLLYLGTGDWTPAHSGRKEQRNAAYVYSLIDTTQIYAFGKEPDPFAQREFHAYDGNATINAAADTLIQPGENGILYTLKLNTQFNEAEGTISVAPTELVKLRYSTSRIRNGMDNNTYWRGMETSPVFWRNYCFFADNSGTLLCVNLNTMNVLWAQDLQDDTNSSPILEIENGKPYIYIAPSLHWTAKDDKGAVSISKVNAMTGEFVWQRPYDCYTVNSVSGGVQATGLLGKNSLSGLVYYAVARTPNKSDGVLVALNKSDGSEKWSFKMNNYTWASPVAVYGQDGTGYVIVGDSAGYLHLLDGLTGNVLDKVLLNEGTIEATPAVFGDMIVAGTRNGGIYGIKIS